MTGKTRVLVVDDSTSIRSIFWRQLAADPEIEVVGYAADGVEDLEKVKTLRPDVLTLDVEMPRMDRRQTIERIMRKSPTPAVMVSALTHEGADVTIQALELGAVDFILKPMRAGVAAVHEMVEELRAKVKLASRANIAGSGVASAGGEVIAQDEASSVLYGMPKSVAEAGHVNSIVPLPRMASEIVRRCRTRRRR